MKSDGILSARIYSTSTISLVRLFCLWLTGGTSEGGFSAFVIQYLRSVRPPMYVKRVSVHVHVQLSSPLHAQRRGSSSV